MKGINGCHQPYFVCSHEDVVTVDVYAAKDLLNSAAYTYLDVRSVEEFNKSHADNAHNVPYMFITEAGRVKNPDFVGQVSALFNSEDNLVVACNSGGRSLKASVDLIDSGFKHIVNVGGGYSAWVDAGFAGNKPAEELKTACKFRP
ncbi:PREDICTED: rhodanese-like domain-containing protein 19, mitochondrial [Lupinus angustifolius]|uniref:rhodanese-like domain-containing protein 19, mitochondrial n=1 Tax=Lupinus angustifolius TaxID=3871 RepID=UPI00092E4D27|nr:PREDICTED: rhodanese-like domain-containing protein 19, mitochondrial [Lupinus angustifolius]